MAIDTISYSICAIAYFIFFSVLITDKHKGNTKNLLLLASSLSSTWAITVAVLSAMEADMLPAVFVEQVKYLAWLTFILAMLKSLKQEQGGLLGSWSILLPAFLVSVVAIESLVNIFLSIKHDSRDYLLVSGLTAAVIGIVLVEQLYRNIKPEQRWAIKYLCLGLLASFVYNFYMYSDGLLYQRIDSTLWSTRGFVEAMLVPLLAMSISRDPMWSPEIFISRRVVFHTTSLVASAVYLFVMGIAGYYVTRFGGSWGPVIQALLLFTTILILVLFLTSRRIRARLKVFVNKHFYPYKYDYREEWLRFIRTISFADDVDLFQKSIRSIAQIIESPGGQLWLRNDYGYYECVSAWNMPVVEVRQPSETSMPRFLENNEFVISVDEFKSEPEVYNRLGYLELPAWVEELQPWLIVPLIHIDRLIGFIVLQHSTTRITSFNWEDSDLLKTASRQAASYIAQQKDSVALAEARQFEDFNKVATYVVHDIKNLTAQLTLITANAEKHKNNPLFMEDVIKTVSNTVNKMNKILEVLGNKRKEKRSATVDLIKVLKELIQMKIRAGNKPLPELGCESDSCMVKADKDQLLSIFGHLVQNAQDATYDNGYIRIYQRTESDQVIIKFKDNGHGMSEAFIKNELFKPFKSTKGEKGMGIGVYETREIIHALGGSIEVMSEPNKGTTFTVKLPLNM